MPKRPKPKNRLGEMLYAARFNQNLRLADVAERAGVSIHTVCTIENGMHPGSLATVMAIVHALGINPTHARDAYAHDMYDLMIAEWDRAA